MSFKTTTNLQHIYSFFVTVPGSDQIQHFLKENQILARKWMIAASLGLVKDF